MAAEHVFYGENTNGVGGDVQTVTARARLDGRRVGDGARADRRSTAASTDEDEEETRERIMKRFEKIGLQIMNRTGGGGADRRRTRSRASSATATSARWRRRSSARRTCAAHHLIQHNRDGVEQVADGRDRAKGEIYGDELVHLLDAQNLRVPEVDLTDDRTWPTL